MCISRATVSAVSCLVVPAFICIDLLISLVLKINDDDDDDDDNGQYIALLQYLTPFTCRPALALDPRTCLANIFGRGHFNK